MDPKAWTIRISDELFVRDLRRLTQSEEELIEANHKAGGPVHGFLFGGKFHTNLPIAQQAASQKKLLHPSLHDAGRAYMNDIKRTEREHIRVRNGLITLLQPCRGDQDVRDALPETVVGLFPELRRMTRLREPGWVFRDSPLKMHTFRETEELLAFYVCNQLIY